MQSLTSQWIRTHLHCHNAPTGIHVVTSFPSSGTTAAFCDDCTLDVVTINQMTSIVTMWTAFFYCDRAFNGTHCDNTRHDVTMRHRCDNVVLLPIVIMCARLAVSSTIQETGRRHGNATYVVTMCVQRDNASTL